jgi:hypothetical protein
MYFKNSNVAQNSSGSSSIAAIITLLLVIETFQVCM